MVELSAEVRLRGVNWRGSGTDGGRGRRQSRVLLFQLKALNLHSSPLEDCPLFQPRASEEGNYFSSRAVNLLSTWERFESSLPSIEDKV